MSISAGSLEAQGKAKLRKSVYKKRFQGLETASAELIVLKLFKGHCLLIAALSAGQGSADGWGWGVLVAVVLLS